MNAAIRTLGLTLALSGFAAALGGCALSTETSEKEDVSAESEQALTGGVRDFGELPGTGEARTVRHTPAPRYGSFTFYANAGEEVDVWVKGQGRADAVAWILNSKDRSLGFNDDAAEGGLNAHIVTKLPANLGTKAKLRVVFREYSHSAATFTVSVRVKPGMFACTADEDCLKVSKGGCCTSYQFVAVNASRAADYAGANTCQPPYPPCAPPPVDEVADRAVARCEANRCVLGEPRGCFYGGVQRNVGDNFPSTDGCNTCFCGADGGVGCTKRACAPTCNEANEPNRRYVGHSPEQCQLVRFACEPGTSMFSNGCGCGCEQPADCPAFINCMPGPGPSSCAIERARCPLTPVAY